MQGKPKTIPHTSRQRITARDGAILERQYVFMPAESWEALQRLCYASHRSGSQVIQHLIANADTGTQVKDKINESPNRSRKA
jgi:hypothetical protein